MACINYTLAGIKKDCTPNTGGIKVVYIASASDVSAITIDDTTATSSTHMVSAITMNSDKKFKEYYFRKNTGSMTSTLNVSDEGSNYITTELALRFSRMETAKRLEVRAMSLNDMVVIVKDANDVYWLLGNPSNDEFVNASQGTGETGTNRDDSNAYTITLSVESSEYPYEVPSSLIKDTIIDYND